MDDLEITYDVIEMEVPVEPTEANEKRIAIELQVSYDAVTIYEEPGSDKTILEVVSDSSVCETLRNQGDFFLSIADALNIDREDIKELV